MSTLRFNTEELVGRFEDRRDVKNLAGKYVMSLLLKKEPTILKDLWSARDDISLGVDDGYYAGRDALAAYYASIDAATKKKAQVLKEVFPEDLGEYSDEKLYGRGPMEIRSLDNAIIEIADDGETAKAFFYVFGLVTDISERGPVSNWVLGSCCFDFIREDGVWKIWHVLYLEDVDDNIREIHRYLTILKHMGVLDGASALLFGEWTMLPADDEANFGYIRGGAFESVAGMIHREFLNDLDIPVAFGFPAGHGEVNYPLLMGETVHVSVSGGSYTVEWD